MTRVVCVNGQAPGMSDDKAIVVRVHADEAVDVDDAACVERILAQAREQ